jgi:beta-lactamase superfamily II metal-dependent hydrolase
MTRNGIAYRPENSAHHTSASASSLLPTITAKDYNWQATKFKADAKGRHSVMISNVLLPTILSTSASKIPTGSIIRRLKSCPSLLPTDLPETRISEMLRKSAERGVYGNFNQKAYPVNPINYMRERDINSVFRFVLTGPDMDHMDGIKEFFSEFHPENFWDTDNNAEKDFGEGSPYNEDDWKFYRFLRDSEPEHDPKRLTLYSGAKNKYWNMDDAGGGGDGIYILSPTVNLVGSANDCGDHNDSSYVILYKSHNYSVIFGGDSHDKTWEHILSTHWRDVQDIDLLIAPHHGRESGRCYDFLDVLRPKLTFFGNASCEHLAYSAWNNRNLRLLTNNQAGSMVVSIGDFGMALYVTHKPFAEKLNPWTTYNDGFKAYFCKIFSKH